MLSPLSVALTVIDVAESSSPRVLGLAERVMFVGVASSSVMVVVTAVLLVSRAGVGPPPPEGLEMATVKVSPVPSSRVSSVV